MNRRILARHLVLFTGGLVSAILAADVSADDAAQQLPPVYFNHCDIVVDPATYDAIAQSQFLKEEFSFARETTVRRDNGRGAYSYTFFGISGRQTYLTFFKPDEAQLRLPNRIAFNMWIDDRTKLPLVRDALAATTHTNPEVGTSRVNGRAIPQFDFTHAEFRSDPANVLAGTMVMGMYPGYLRQVLPEIKPEQEGTSREKDNARRYLPERLLNDITRFTFIVNKAEADQLLQEFHAYGFTIRTNGYKHVATGPGIEFVLLNTEPAWPRKLAIDMKLNRAKTGEQSYQFGSGSEIRFKGDTASWYFPAGWRP